MDDILNTAPCGFLSFSDQGLILKINLTLLTLLEYTEDDLLTKHIKVILPIASQIFYKTHLLPYLKLHQKVDEIFISLKAQSGVNIPVLINCLRKKRDEILVNDCILMPMQKRIEYEDQIIKAKKLAQESIQIKEKINKELLEITAQLELEKQELLMINTQLEAIATTDGLTGLTNHRAFQQKLTQEIANIKDNPGKSLSLLLIDIDYFKKINDLFGHPMGDKYLINMADIFKKNARSQDIVARYGGEEFVIILPNTDQVEAIAVAEHFRHQVEIAKWPETPATISIGVSSFAHDIKDKSSLISTTDQALYQSKKNGRNRVTLYQNSAQ